MSPLSALQLPVTPDLNSVLTQAAGNLGSLGKTIPASELEKLTPGIAPSTSVQSPSAAGTDFSSTLGQMVNEVNSKQVAAGDAVNGLLTGGNVSLHQAMIAMEEANVSLQLMIQVRNKLLESYQELMRMQV